MGEDGGGKKDNNISKDGASPAKRPVVGESRIRLPSHSTRRGPDERAPVGKKKQDTGAPVSTGDAASKPDDRPRASERRPLFDVEADSWQDPAEPDATDTKASAGPMARAAKAAGSIATGSKKLAGAAWKRVSGLSLDRRKKKSGEDGQPLERREKWHGEWHPPRWTKITVAVFAAWLAITVVAGGVLEIANIGKMSKGVRVDGKPVGGMTAKAALEEINKEMAPLSQPLVFTFKDKKFPLGMDTIKLKVRSNDMVTMAYLHGRDSFLPLRVAKRLLGVSSNVNMPVLYDVDKRSLTGFVTEISKAVDRAPVSASIALKDGSPVIKPSYEGITVQREATIKVALDALSKKERGVGVVVKYKKPDVLESDIGKIVVIQLSNFTLFLYDRTELTNDFTIACGMPQYPTPPGRYHVTYKERNPTWLPTSEWAKDKQGIPQPPGPDNPLGGYWMDIGGGLGIHATPYLKTLGSAASHGCIRMSDEGAAAVFDAVKVGTPVLIIP